MIEKIQKLCISENRRYLVREDGTLFFWLADTAWELFHKLNREEAELYLRNRAEKGFTVIQAVALPENDGLRMGNAYGRVPLLTNAEGKYGPLLPDLEGDETDSGYSYWKHVDYIISLAASYGLYIALLPTWGDKFSQKWGQGPEIFDPENAFGYGRWIGDRYKDFKNILWVMGGDRALETGTHHDIIRAMAKGIRTADSGGHLMTFHPQGELSSASIVHQEDWLDFNMMQSGHGRLHLDNYSMLTEGYGKSPVKPILDGEPRYEDHPVGFKAENGYFDQWDVRQAAYWSILAGACGHTYGHHSIWSMCTAPADYYIMDWKMALDRPGAVQMKYLRQLAEARPLMEGEPDEGMLDGNYPGANHIQAFRGRDFAYAYSPNGLKVKVHMGKIAGQQVRASWFDPRTGVLSPAGEYENSGVVEFVPPCSGRGSDWLLVLETLL